MKSKCYLTAVSRLVLIFSILGFLAFTAGIQGPWGALAVTPDPIE